MASYTLPVGKDETACQLLARNGFVVGAVIKDHPRYRHVQFPKGWRLMHHQQNKEAIFNPESTIVAVVVKGDHPRVHFTLLWSYTYHDLRQRVLISRGPKHVTSIYGIRNEVDAQAKAVAWLDTNHPNWRTALC